MPALPWTATANPFEPDEPVVVLASRLELRSYRDVVRFLRAALRIRKQVRASEGALGLALDAQPLRRTFWTLSAWTDRASIDAFVGTPPHVDVMREFGGRLTAATFETWTVPGRELPGVRGDVHELWGDGRRRLAGGTD